MKTRIIPFVLLSFLPGFVHALGLGPITTQSFLGEPFVARIEILSATVPELDSLIVVPGGADAFQRAGLELTPDIKKLQFKIVGVDEGEHYIQVSSPDAVREPILSFVVEARWISGQMSRTYAVLLDPPYYAAAERRRSLAKKETQAPIGLPEPTVRQEPPAPPVIPAQITAPAISSTKSDTRTVMAGDTLGSIANETRPDASISTDQMMLAILRANPDAFIHGNVNNIKLGSTLRLPEREEILAIDKQEATERVRMQYAQWKNAQVATSDTTASTTAESGQPGLRILTPDADPGDLPSNTGPGTGGDTDLHSLKKELALATESIESYRSENADLEARLAAAEARIDDLKSTLKKGLPMEVPVHEEPPGTELYGPVAAGENLWNIANKIRPDLSVSTNQMMLALLRANPEAFINGNINRLRSGAVLHMPDIPDIQSLSKAEAAEEVNSQYLLWKRRE